MANDPQKRDPQNPDRNREPKPEQGNQPGRPSDPNRPREQGGMNPGQQAPRGTDRVGVEDEDLDKSRKP